MSDKNLLVGPIDGYTIAVFKVNPDKSTIVGEFDLKLSKVGGAHVTNPDSLIMMIEDAVFAKEQGDERTS